MTSSFSGGWCFRERWGAHQAGRRKSQDKWNQEVGGKMKCFVLPPKACDKCRASVVWWAGWNPSYISQWLSPHLKGHGRQTLWWKPGMFAGHLHFLPRILEFGCCSESFTLLWNQTTTWTWRTIPNSGKAFWDSCEDRQLHNRPRILSISTLRQYGCVCIITIF